MSGILYIVATPIGNLEDITLRALKVLKEVDLILTEDTRVSNILLRHYDIIKHILSYHQHSSDEKKFEILKYLLEEKNIALITDAGTPGISDPSNELIDFILDKEPKIKIIPIPGPSAVISALSVCGFNVNKFIFIGFIPKKRKSKILNWIKNGKISFAFYESPRRIMKTLHLLEEIFGKETRVFIAREITKVYETLYRGNITEVVNELEKENIRGEIVVVVEISAPGGN